MEKELEVINKVKRCSELTVNDLQVYCEEAGVTVYSMCRKLNELMNAKRFDGWKDVDDSNVQLKALTVGLEMLKLIGGKTLDVSGVVVHEHKTVPVEDIKSLEEIFKKSMELRIRRDRDPIQRGEPIDITRDFRDV